MFYNIVCYKEVYVKRIEFYKDRNGKEIFIEWLDNLDFKTRDIIIKRIYRVKNNNYGNHKRLKKGLIEIKLDFSSGYRIYFIEAKNKIILLYGGDKKTQQKDIKKAQEYIKELKEWGQQ